MVDKKFTDLKKINTDFILSKKDAHQIKKQMVSVKQKTI